MKNKIKILCFLAVLGILAVQTSCNYYSLNFLCSYSSLTETEAKEIAKKRLKDFCERKGIDITEFPEPEISKQEDVPWIIDYTSKKDHKKPYYFFRVIIDSCGRIETSWQYYDFGNK